MTTEITLWQIGEGTEKAYLFCKLPPDRNPTKGDNIWAPKFMNQIDLEDFLKFHSQCNVCGRKSGKESLGKLCKMPHNLGLTYICKGKFIPYREDNNHDENLPHTY